MSALNEVDIKSGEAAATSAAGIAGVVTGNPEIVPLTIAAEALFNAIMNIQQASKAKGTLSQAELDKQWIANSKAMGVALTQFKEEK